MTDPRGQATLPDLGVVLWRHRPHRCGRGRRTRAASSHARLADVMQAMAADPQMLSARLLIVDRVG
jgi:hypothetical protein